jgi:hypothetical protein
MQTKKVKRYASIKVCKYANDKSLNVVKSTFIINELDVKNKTTFDIYNKNLRFSLYSVVITQEY